MDALTGPVMGPHEGVNYANAVRLRTHAADQCAGQWCSIHNPSAHAMRAFPQSWRIDRGTMERICPHGIGHPDPDHLSWVRTVAGPSAAEMESVHACDGCCHP